MSEKPEEPSLDRKQKVLMPYLGLDFRSARKRVLDFREVTIPFAEERAKYEALRCIDCPDPPCVQGCPLHNNIPQAMIYASQGEFIKAARVFQKTSNMPQVCGRVCPQEQLCQGSCVLNNTGEPVLIGAIEAYVTDTALRDAPVEPQIPPATGKRVAVVGAGPAGLSCAEQLALHGHAVTILESRPEAGGLLIFGIPGFKLDHQIVFKIIERLKSEGIRFQYETSVGKDLMIDDLLLEEGYDAVFIAVGAGVDSPIKIPGEDLPGIFKATEFLLRATVDFKYLPESMRSIPEVGEKVIVVGGGDTSSDCVRTAKRLGAVNVTCLYRRTEAEMPGVTKDRHLAREEGVEYQFLTQPIRFIAGENGKLASIECIKMELGEEDQYGRRRPVPVAESNFLIDADTVVLAVGYQPYPTIGDTTPGLATHQWGLIVVDENTCQTSREGIYAGGDAKNGPDLVVTAVADGRRAAEAIHFYLSKITP
jgi:glutamate synthase (NADPH/NADH) small chain